MKIAQVALASSMGMLILGAHSPLQAAVTPITVNSVGPIANQWGSPDPGTAPLGIDGSEISQAIGHPNAWVTYDFGQLTSFSDVSVTQYDATGTYPNANYFSIQTPINPTDPTGATGWTTVASASNIFGYEYATQSNWNAGRRLEFTPTTARYFRFVNQNPVTGASLPGYTAFEELQVGRNVVITASSAGVPGVDTAHSLNRATDNNPNTAFRSAGTSGSFDFDALVPTGQGVNTITLQHASSTDQSSAYTFPTGTVTVLDSNDPTFATFNSTNFTLNSDESLGTAYSLTYATPVDSRYFRFEWNNVVTPTATNTQFAEVGITTSPITVPEPASMSLLAAGAGLLLLRRRRRSHESQEV